MCRSCWMTICARIFECLSTVVKNVENGEMFPERVDVIRFKLYLRNVKLILQALVWLKYLTLPSLGKDSFVKAFHFLVGY